MGKRELLLVIAFVVVGVVVYQATAPPAAPNARGFSLSNFMEHVRREIRGNRAFVEATTVAHHEVSDDVTELRFTDSIAELEITGEDRADVETSLRVHSNAYDDAEARKLAGETVLKTDRAASSLELKVDYPGPGSQRAFLSVKVPARVRIRIESRPRKLSITNVAGVEAANTTGDTNIKTIAGRVAISHRGGDIRIDGAAALKFSGRSSDATITNIRGDASFSLEAGGELKASALTGPLDVEARNVDVTFDDLAKTRGPIRVNSTNGRVRLNGVTADTRLDGRNAELDVVMVAAAPVAIYSEGEDVLLTVPAGGFQIDALALDGRIGPDPIVSELGLERAQQDEPTEQRASGSVRGGGPMITVRATRGDVTLRQPEKPPQ